MDLENLSPIVMSVEAADASLEQRKYPWVNYKFNPWVRQLWVIRK